MIKKMNMLIIPLFPCHLEISLRLPLFSISLSIVALYSKFNFTRQKKQNIYPSIAVKCLHNNTDMYGAVKYSIKSRVTPGEQFM